jgi:hypothetical protein
MERKAEELWRKFEDRQRSGGKSTGEACRAAVKGALAAVISLLHRDDALRDRVASIGEPMRCKPRHDGGGRRSARRQRAAEEEREFVQEHIVPRMVHEFGAARVAEFQARAVQTHFWCELLAQTAWALKKFREQYEKAEQFVVDALTVADEPHPPLWVQILPYEDMVRRAVGLVFELMPRTAGLPAPKDMFRLIWPVRVLACLMCKDPSKHPAVRTNCLNPILKWGEARVRDEVRERMGWAFPAEWPDLGKSGSGVA